MGFFLPFTVQNLLSVVCSSSQSLVMLFFPPIPLPFGPALTHVRNVITLRVSPRGRGGVEWEVQAWW